MWWTNERTDNNTHKPQWQPHFSKVIWPQYPNPSPCTVGRTGEHMKWQQYHQHQCRLMIRHLDTSACQILCHFSKGFVSESARLNRCYKTVEIKWSMSYPCLMIPIMSSSIRFELKMISALQWRHNERDCVSNHQPPDCLLNRLFRRRSKKTSKLCVTSLCVGNLPVNSPHKWPVTQFVWEQNGVSNKNSKNYKKSQFLRWCDLDPLTHDHEKLINSGHYHYHCVYQIWKQSTQCFLSYCVNHLCWGWPQHKTITPTPTPIL